MEPGVVDKQSPVRPDGHDVNVSMLPGNVVVGVALPRSQRVSGVVVDPADRQHQDSIRARQIIGGQPEQGACLIDHMKDCPRQGNTGFSWRSSSS